MREKYESLSLATLKDLAKARGLKGVSALRKPELIERMLHEDELEGETKKQETVREKPQQSEVEGNGERIPQYNKTPERTQYHAPAEAVQLDSGERADGILEVLPDGYGFIRCENYLPGENDIYVSPSQIRRFNLKTGDIIKGNIRIKTQGEKFSALLYVTSINGFHPSEGQRRYNFEDMTPIFPNERLIMERPGGTVAMRIVDLISPIGKGQRGMIVSPPKAGKTTLLKSILGLIPPLSGEVEQGDYLEIGYFEQEVKGENRNSCIEELWQEFPSYTQYQVRSALAKCGLTTKHIESQVRVLSGGEQAKVRLCKLLNRDTNFLLLDEPTNHLDVDAKDSLKQALQEYKGSILLICHEPEFYQDVVDEVWDMSQWTTKVF